MRYACFQPALDRLMAALVPLVVDAAHRRIARGELSFDDLLVLTRRLLKTRPDIRALVRARHRHLFVDEFQDTDQVQFDVLTELTSTDARPAVVDVRGRRPEAIDLRIPRRRRRAVLQPAGGRPLE
jgi:ATP-dependent exoDNAse (exonuclease V) beta subunit